MLALPTVSGVNLVLGSAIAALLAVPQAIVYTMLSRRISRTGGDYVWVSRSLGGFVGSIMTFTGITLETMPYLALIALSAVFAIGSVGVALGYSSMLGLALPGNVLGGDPLSQFLLASSLLIVLIAINIIKPRLGFKIISIFWVIGIIAMAVATLALLNAGKAGVENYVDGLGVREPDLHFRRELLFRANIRFAIYSTNDALLRIVYLPLVQRCSLSWF